MEANTSQRIMSTIYRQNWPPPCTTNGAIRGKKFEKIDKSKEIAGNLLREGTPFQNKQSTATNKQGFKSNRAEKIRSGAEKIRRPASCYRQIRPSSASERSTVVKQVEYVTMLSSKNYLRKMYREQFRAKDPVDAEGCVDNRAITPSKITIGYSGIDTYKYYPDMGSVIAKPLGKRCVMSASSTPIYPREGWKMANKTKSLYDQKSHTGINEDSQKSNIDSDSSIASSRSTPIYMFSSKRTWSNVPMGKSYRLQKQAIDTLASISLEGKRTIHQPRSKSSSSFQSYMNEMSLINRLSSTGESVSLTPSDSESNESKVDTKVDLDQIYVDDEEYERTKLLIDPAIYQSNEIMELFQEEDCTRKNSVTSANSTDNENNYDEDSIDSDATEWGINAEDNQNENLLNQEELERRILQVSAVFSTQSGENESERGFEQAQMFVDSDVNEQMSELSCSDNDQYIVDNTNKFAVILPVPFHKLDLQHLANLPPDLDWRTCVDLPRYVSKMKASSENKRLKCSNNSHKANKYKKLNKKSLDKSLQELKQNEIFVDKLVNLERLQSLTVQYEKERRLHLQHLQRSRSRTSRQRRPSTTSEVPNGKSLPNKLTVEQELNRLLKPAGNPDTLKPDDLKTRNILRTSSSQSIARRFTSYRRPWQPRSYDYTCSERFKDPRGQIRSLTYPKTRSCTFCRERVRRNSLSNLPDRRPSSTSLQFVSINQNRTATPRTPLKPSNRTRKPTTENSVHGITSIENQESAQDNTRQPYPCGQASVKVPNMFNTKVMSIGFKSVNTIGKEYTKIDSTVTNKNPGPSYRPRPRTSSIGSRQRKRVKKKDMYYFNQSEIKFGIL